MYIDPAKAVAELGRRRKDKKLFAEVLDYLGELPAGWPEDRPIATINRYVATARVEDLVFAHAALSLGIRPFWPTYLEEKYMATNPEKVSCLRPRIQRPKMQATRNWIVDNPKEWSGQPLGSVQVNGTNLQELHQTVRRAILPDGVAENVFDISDWNQAQAVRFGGSLDNGRLAPFYYHAVMAFYICHGILFEDFDGGPNAQNGLKVFVDTVVMPAFKSVAKIFGLEPLIVRLPYCPGFLDYPSNCGPIFDQATSGFRT